MMHTYTRSIYVCFFLVAKEHVGRFDDDHDFAMAVAHLSIGHTQCALLLSPADEHVGSMMLVFA